MRFGRIEGQATSAESRVLPLDALTEVAIPPDCDFFGLRMRADALLNKLAALIGAVPSRKLVFDRTRPTNGQLTDNLRRILTFFQGNWMPRHADSVNQSGINPAVEEQVVRVVGLTRLPWAAHKDRARPSG
jgi:hypothetical protein